MFGTDIMIKLRMFGFTNIPELVSPPPPSSLKTPEGCKNKSCVFAFLYFHSPPVCTIQHFWFYPDFCAKHLGELSSFIVVFGPCRALRGEGTISKMCLQLNILDSILTVGLQHLSGAQLSGAPRRVVLITPSSWFKLLPVVFVFLLVYYLRKHLSFWKSEWFRGVSNFLHFESFLMGISMGQFSDIEFAYYAFKSGKLIKQTPTPPFWGMLAWKSGLRCWIRALEVPFLGTWKWVFECPN